MYVDKDDEQSHMNSQEEYQLFYWICEVEKQKGK